MNYTPRCTCCDRKLNPETAVSLELDTRIGRYHDQVPGEHSQGGFEFGPACAKKELREARVELEQAGLMAA